MLSVRRLQPSDIEPVKLFSTVPEQVKFAGTPEEFLDSGSETTHLHVVLLDDEVVGFFKIDTDYSKNYAFCSPNSLGIRALFVSLNHQGKGIGVKTMKVIKPYLNDVYGQYSRLYLTVNCKNPIAVKCYQKAGFIELDELYTGGPNGPQHVMTLSL